MRHHLSEQYYDTTNGHMSATDGQLTVRQAERYRFKYLYLPSILAVFL